MVDYEKGSPAWDIGIILTRHSSVAHGNAFNCARVQSLLNTRGQPGADRLAHALGTKCTCGKGDAVEESTSLREDAKNDD